MKIGIIREGKRPIDRRVPLTPAQAKKLTSTYPGVEVVVQPSSIRCFLDTDYAALGLPVQDDLHDCDILLGVKEVPIPDLIPNKTYFFFSHTIKKQAYNRDLLRSILQKNITLVDYEVLTDPQGQRVIAFGRYAGIVGAYNGIWAYGQRTGSFSLKRAYKCHDLKELQKEFQKVKLPPIKIALTGTGRVGQGAMEVLDGMGIKRVSVRDFLEKPFTEAVYVSLDTSDYNQTTDGRPFDLAAFYQDPRAGFTSNFKRFLPQTDLLIAGAYWDMRAPVLFEKSDMKTGNFNIQVIADITCDIEGSIPSTKQPSTIDDPIYDYNTLTDKIEPATFKPGSITVMAVDNLPCELPRDASTDFGQMLTEKVLPYFLGEDTNGIRQRATITHQGKLTPTFDYLTDYVS
ncbi:MAG: NAD(P)-dependent oxidoreductase [Bernardetiaceae bacterium]